MNKDIVLPVLGLVVGSMPVWIKFVIDPSWASATRKKILVVLFVIYTSLLVYALTLLAPDRYENLLTQRIAEFFFLLNWALLIIRVYQLWPRRGE